MRLVFLGSPEPVLSVLKKIVEEGPSHGHSLLAVVSQPAKAMGRSNKVQDPPVAAWAKSQGLQVLQPESARNPEFLASLRELQPDVMITAAYGQILNEDFLKIPSRATINIHPSLLPVYRGAIPVQAALLNGDTTTGVSILFTVRRLDAGAIISQESHPILPTETAEQLLPRLFDIGSKMLFDALDKLKDSQFVGTTQDENLVTHCRKIAKEDGLVHWKESSAALFNRYRAFQPWPGLFTFLGEKRISLLEIALPKADQTRAGRMNSAGSFLFNKGLQAIEVVTGDSSILVKRLLPAGGKPQDASSFWNGIKNKDSAFFGPTAAESSIQEIPR